MTEGGSYLKKLTVNYSRAPNSEGVVAVKKTSLKTKLLEKLFGTSTQVVILIPGKTCGSVTVNNCDEGGKDDVKI